MPAAQLLSLIIKDALRAARPNIKDSTLQVYADSLNALSRGTHKPVPSMLRDTEGLDAYIARQYTKASSLASVYTAAFVGAQALALPQPTLSHYNAAMRKHAAARDEASKTNRGRTKLLDAGLTVIPWAALVRRVSAMDSYDMQHAMLAMYILMPPRRLEYRFLAYYTKPPVTPEPHGLDGVKPPGRPSEEQADPKTGVAWNYLHKSNNDGGCGLRMVLRSHKRDGAQGVFATDLPPAVSDVLQRYFQEAHINRDGDDVFPNRRSGGIYSHSAFSAALTGALKRHSGYPGIRLGVDDLRHACITHSRSGNSQSYADKEALAKRMGHNVSVADISYNKVSR